METSSAESRLVADHEARSQGKSPGDADTLALPSREAVRVPLDMRRSRADESDELMHHLAAGEGIANTVDHQRLFDDVIDSHPRVQGSKTDPEK